LAAAFGLAGRLVRSFAMTTISCVLAPSLRVLFK
jgi:hypothetical protein